MAVLAALSAAAWFAGACRAGIELGEAFPTAREQTLISIFDQDGEPVPGAAVTATYRPGSRVSRTDDLGKTAAAGTIEWTPRKAGIVTLRAIWTAADGSERSAFINTSVRYDPAPVSGIVVLVIAGVVLLGGSVERICALLRSPENL